MAIHSEEIGDGNRVHLSDDGNGIAGARDQTGHIKNMILDIGGVLLQPNLDVSYEGRALPPYQFKRMLRSHTWFEYQIGKLSPDEAFRQLSLESGYPAEDIRSFGRKARESLVPITQMIDIVVQLSKDSKLRLFGMTNSPAEDFEFLRQAYPDLFGRFERIFTSAAAGMRKPNANYFLHVLKETGISPSETLFVDDSISNVIAAEVLGLTAILARPEAIDKTVRQLVFHIRTEEERLTAAHEYLERTRGVHKSLSLTSDGLRVPVVFDHFIIAFLLDDERFLPTSSAPVSGKFNFFPDEELKVGRDPSELAFTHFNFPDDLDTTSIALATLYKFSRVGMAAINRALDDMEKCVNEEGILQMYYDPFRPRVDHVCNTNVIFLFHLAGRTTPTKETEAYLLKILSNGAYLRGSLYYSSPETFLYHLSRPVCTFKEHFEKAGFARLLEQRLNERVGVEGDALTLAMRVVACVQCGIPKARLWRERERLAKMQNVDGSWDVCPYYSYYDPNSWFGNEALTTAFALRALQTLV